MKGIAVTSLWVAAARALESEREGGWFRDPFARALAGEQGFAVHRASLAMSPVEVPTIQVRTRWIDERIADARTRGLDQVVILAAGMDARSYRLESLRGARVFELDRDFVLDYKAEKIGGTKPACERIEIAVDLRDDWPRALRAAKFDPAKPTLWLVEGLLTYLNEHDVRGLLARVDSNAAPSSEVLFDMLGRSLLDSPWIAATLEAMRQLDAPWLFGTDEPEALFGDGWSVEAYQFGHIGAQYGRWPFPVLPRGSPNMPESFLVRALKLSS